MSMIRALNLFYRYKIYHGDETVTEKTALSDIQLNIEKGQFVGIIGGNGSGKSTLAKNLAGLVAPSSGIVYVDGMDTRDQDNIWNVRKTAGMILQNPDNQLIASNVEEDVAFGPENLGLDRETMVAAVTAALKSVGMSKHKDEDPNNLSGGQKQRVAIAGILAMNPECIILDEPTAMLDPEGRRDVLAVIRRLNKENGITIILITHYVDEVEDADYLYVMDGGEIQLEGRPDQVWTQEEELYRHHLTLPFHWRLRKEIEKMQKRETSQEKSCLSKDRLYQIRGKDDVKLPSELPSEDRLRDGIELTHVSFCYNPDITPQRYALSDISLKIKRGEFVALIGKTGCGKSTLLQQLNGLLRPTGGTYTFDGEDVWGDSYNRTVLRQKVALCFQFPEYQLFEETVLEDVMFGPLNMGASKDESLRRAKKAMKLLGLGEDLEGASPFSLSGGQQRRVALAGILAMEPEFLVLDEPAAGLDYEGKTRLYRLLKKLNEEDGITVIMVSHDMNDVARLAKRVIVIDQGQEMLDGSPQGVFADVTRIRRLGLEVPTALEYFDKNICQNVEEVYKVPLTVEELGQIMADYGMKVDSLV